MLNHPRNTLAIIGAGPKGLAVAVKAKVLAEFGFPVDRVVLIEKHSVAAHWSGEAGYTNGEMKLGTSPEKDVVFPLETQTGDSVLDRKIKKRLMDFSWVSYLIQSNSYSDWVDRGRPAPTHKKWSDYLKWVSLELGTDVTIIRDEVQGIDLTPGLGEWMLQLKSHGRLKAERLMLTGPGKTRSDFAGTLRNAYDLESFWRALNAGETFKGKIAIVGAGENAASVLMALSKKGTGPIEVISPKGFISTRAENYHENQFYSRPEDKGWKKLRLEDRMDFIRRTDLGVFSVEAMQSLNKEENHRIIPGRMCELTSCEGSLKLTLDYDGEKNERTYDHVILATGFDQLGTMRSLMSERAINVIEENLGHDLTNHGLALAIDEDLSVKGHFPSLHLPMLAGLTQGPGFANLSCLGLLSDRIVLSPLQQRVERTSTLNFLEA